MNLSYSIVDQLLPAWILNSENTPLLPLDSLQNQYP